MLWLTTLVATALYEGTLLGVTTRVTVRDAGTCEVSLDGWAVGGERAGDVDWKQSSGEVRILDDDFDRFLKRRRVVIKRVRRWLDLDSDYVVVDVKLPVWGEQRVLLYRVD